MVGGYVVRGVQDVPRNDEMIAVKLSTMSRGVIQLSWTCYLLAQAVIMTGQSSMTVEDFEVGTTADRAGKTGGLKCLVMLLKVRMKDRCFF